MDRLQEALNRQLLEPDRGIDLETGMDVVQLGRHYERFADHTVSVAKRVAAPMTSFPQVRLHPGRRVSCLAWPATSF